MFWLIRPGCCYLTMALNNPVRLRSHSLFTNETSLTVARAGWKWYKHEGTAAALLSVTAGRNVYYRLGYSGTVVFNKIIMGLVLWQQTFNSFVVPEIVAGRSTQHAKYAEQNGEWSKKMSQICSTAYREQRSLLLSIILDTCILLNSCGWKFWLHEVAEGGWRLGARGVTDFS